MTRWYSVRIPTYISATNTFCHCHTQVPRPHKNEWINWRKRVSAANSRATTVAASSSSATLPKLKPYLRKRGRRSLLHIKCGRLSRCRLRKTDRRERCLYKICEVHRYSSNVISIGKYDRLSLR